MRKRKCGKNQHKILDGTSLSKPVACEVKKEEKDEEEEEEESSDGETR